MKAVTDTQKKTLKLILESRVKLRECRRDIIRLYQQINDLKEKKKNLEFVIDFNLNSLSNQLGVEDD